MRTTATGVEVLNTVSVPFAGAKILYLVTIDAVDDGSSISAYSLKNIRDDGLARVDLRRGQSAL
jgi:hypothetical protein